MNETEYIVAGGLIDGSGTPTRRNVFLAVKKGIITAIDSAARLPQDHGGAIADFSRCLILPALVDCSVSLTRSPSVDGAVRTYYEAAGPARKAAMLQRHIGDYHAHGVLGVADDSGDLSDLLKDDGNEPVQQCVLAIRSSGSVSRSRLDCPAGRDFVKISYSEMIPDGNAPSPADLCRIVQHGDTQKTVVVANGRKQVAEALAAGCDAIEQGYAMGEDNLSEMARRDVLWIPSLIRAKNGLDGASSGGDVCCRFSQRYVAPGKPVPGAEKFWKNMLTGQLRQLRLARNMGVVTAVGTGAGNVGILHGESMIEEMKLFIKAGYSKEETIRCASTTGAGFFGMTQLGTLTVGRPATFLLFRGTEQQLPRKLSYLEGIYMAGKPSPNYKR